MYKKLGKVNSMTLNTSTTNATYFGYKERGSHTWTLKNPKLSLVLNSIPITCQAAENINFLD